MKTYYMYVPHEYFTKVTTAEVYLTKIDIFFIPSEKKVQTFTFNASYFMLNQIHFLLRPISNEESSHKTNKNYHRSHVKAYVLSDSFTNICLMT